MTSSASENITPSNLHARRAPMVGCPLGMHRIMTFLLTPTGHPFEGNPVPKGVAKVKLSRAKAGATTPQNKPIPSTHSP